MSLIAPKLNDRFFALNIKLNLAYLTVADAIHIASGLSSIFEARTEIVWYLILVAILRVKQNEYENV